MMHIQQISKFLATKQTSYHSDNKIYKTSHIHPDVAKTPPVADLNIIIVDFNQPKQFQLKKVPPGWH